jgi:hypothetical protein
VESFHTLITDLPISGTSTAQNNSTGRDYWNWLQSKIKNTGKKWAPLHHMALRALACGFSGKVIDWCFDDNNKSKPDHLHFLILLMFENGIKYYEKREKEYLNLMYNWDSL